EGFVVGEEPGPVEAGGEPADLGDGHPLVEPGPLGDVADVLPQRDRGAPAVLAEDAGLAGVGPEQAGEYADGGRLAGAVLAEEGEDRPARHLQGEVGEGGLAAEPLGKAADVDDRLARGAAVVVGFHQRFSLMLSLVL